MYKNLNQDSQFLGWESENQDLPNKEEECESPNYDIQL
jgi:hypothetical protein